MEKPNEKRAAWYYGNDELNNTSKYEFSFLVPESKANTARTELANLRTVCDNRKSLVYHRLYDDFQRRQEVKQKLKSMMKLNDIKGKIVSLSLTNRSSKTFRKSLSQARAAVDRLNSASCTRQPKARQMSKEKLTNTIPKRTKSREGNVKASLNNERVSLKEKPGAWKETVSIREAIESGRRIKNSSGLITPTRSPIERNNSKSGSPSKTMKPSELMKKIDEIFARCKRKANTIILKKAESSPIYTN